MPNKMCKIPYVHDFPDYPCFVCFPEKKKKGNKTHGMTNTSEFNTWQNIHSRCYNKNNQDYHRYGGRGIKVCKRWNKFEKFFEDMGKKPSKEYSIDRINNNSDYSKKNCRWATNKEQSRNRIQNIKYKGECAMDASLRLGGNIRLVDKRIKLGWSKHRAFNQCVMGLGVKRNKK